jgi:hypothetical protein
MVERELFDLNAIEKTDSLDKFELEVKILCILVETIEGGNARMRDGVQNEQLTEYMVYLLLLYDELLIQRFKSV